MMMFLELMADNKTFFILDHIYNGIHCGATD